MVDCAMNLSLDSIAHVSKDLMERFVKLKVDILCNTFTLNMTITIY